MLMHLLLNHFYLWALEGCQRGIQDRGRYQGVKETVLT